MEEGRAYSSLRENNNAILLLDPCDIDNFGTNLDDEIRKLIDGSDGTDKWSDMPQTILVPFLSSAHWRILKIDINYDAKSATLLWDDPYGRSHGTYDAAEAVICSIRENIKLLIGNKHRVGESGFVLSDPNLTMMHKAIDQQGLEKDGSSCGIIAFKNIEDYLVSTTQGKDVAYTIPVSGEDDHRDILASIKSVHVKMYSDVTEQIIIPIYQQQNLILLR